MKFSLDIPIIKEYVDPRVLADLDLEAENAGWDGFFIWDLLFFIDPDNVPMVDPWIALAAIAMKTKRLRIGALVTPLVRCRPWKVARETVSLDYLSNGRLIFGSGLGYNIREFSAFREEENLKIRGQKLDEALEILTGLWSGNRFSFHGKYYQVENVQYLPKPVQLPRIPIWIAGFWPNRKPFIRASKWDGIYIGCEGDEKMEPLVIKEALKIIKKHRTNSKPFDVTFYGETPLDKDDAMEIIKPYIESGVTWWLGSNDRSFNKMEERIRAGPPKF